jgi:ferredoxin-type protein NapH
MGSHNMPATRGLIRRNKWLLLRRFVQFSILGLFMSGPFLGVWILQGNLASSTLFGKIPFTDPFIALQSIAAGHTIATPAIIGVALILALYLLVGGRSFCAWVCPINPVTDAAAALRDTLGFKANVRLSRFVRHGLVLVILLVSYLMHDIAFEAVNPITILHRGILFGMGVGWIVILAVFLFDLFVAKHGWCGHICPVGAFYGFINRFSLTRISARNRESCTDCGDCFRVCPEPQVIAPALYARDAKTSPIIASSDCITCGRCIDVCEPEVFNFTHRFDKTTGANAVTVQPAHS